MIYSSYELAYAAGTADNRLFINEVSRYDLPITPKNSTCWSWTASLTLCHENIDFNLFALYGSHANIALIIK